MSNDHHVFWRRTGVLPIAPVDIATKVNSPAFQLSLRQLPRTKPPSLYTHQTYTMSYNPRMSIVPNMQQQNRKKKEEESDGFVLVCASPPTPPECRLTAKIARQGNRGMYQRYWSSLHGGRSPKAKSTANPNDLRMVRGTAYERDSRDGRPCNARSC